jgi:hypothetical protein
LDSKHEDENKHLKLVVNSEILQILFASAKNMRKIHKVCIDDYVACSTLIVVIDIP